MSESFTPVSHWPYSSDLDALIAAPRHHQLLLENDFVRVIDACVPPGETTAVHTHRWPSTLYILSWSDFVRYDGQGNVLLDSRNMKTTPGLQTALWSEPLPPHALKNLGEKDLRIITVEVKTAIINS